MIGSLSAHRERLFRILKRDLWVTDLTTLPRLRRIPLKLARVLYLSIKGFTENGAFLRASALTYITVLSIVPFLALAFSVAKGLGLYTSLRESTIQPFFDRTMGHMGSMREAGERILELVEKTDVANLGLVGLLAFLYTALRLMASVEGSFNVIWGAGTSRSWPRKVSHYLTLVFVTPLFMIIAAALTTAAQSAPLTGLVAERLHLGDARDLLLTVLPHAAVWAGFTFIYLVIPNARVHFVSALLGGIVGGSLWQIALELHIKSQAGLAQYNAVYSSFAALPVFLVWLYAGWSIILFGAELAAAHQSEPSYRQIALSRPTDPAFCSAVALRSMTRITTAFLEGGPPLTPSALSEELDLPVRLVNHALSGPVSHGLLVCTAEKSEQNYLLARDPSTIRVCDVLDALRGTAGPVDVPVTKAADQRIDRVLSALDEDTRKSPHNRTLRDLAEEARDGKKS